MKTSENEQEFLFHLWTAVEEEEKAGLAMRDAPGEIVAALIEKGMVVQDGELLKFTSSGHAETAAAIRRHRLAERLLADVLTTKKELVHRQACHMEHALIDGLDDSICTLLGHPRYCPHGLPIPTGKCCQRLRENVDRLIAPLAELKPGQSGHISYIHLNNASHMQKLMAMGVLPGVPVRLVRRFPSVVFEAGNSQFAVDEEIAAEVYIRIDNDKKEAAKNSMQGS